MNQEIATKLSLARARLAEEIRQDILLSTSRGSVPT